MAERSELSLVRPPSAASVVPSRDEWATIYDMAKMLVPTGFLPSGIKTPEQATAIILKGKELSVPPMYALSNIVIVQGKPTCSAELMLALVHRDCGRDAMRVKHSDNTSCTVQWRQWGEVNEYRFTIEDAKQAGLLSNQTWTKYPAAMLRARCISAVCRMAFPGSIAGMYTPEELGAVVTVSPDGEVEVIQDDRHAAYVANAKPDEPTPIKTTAQLMDDAQGKEEAPAPLKVAKQRLWSEAKRRGMSKDLLNDYAAEQMGVDLEELAIGAVNDLCERLKAEADNDQLLDRLSNAPDDDGEFVDVAMFDTNSPDRFTR